MAEMLATRQGNVLRGLELEARVRALLQFKQHTNQVEHALGVLLALVRATEAKDPATAAHLQRVAYAALLIGQRLGLSETALMALHYGAMLHDIGKIGVDDAIVRKQGPLTPMECRQMRQHPLIGERIVQSLHLAAEVAPIVRGHHERWDGCGYPDGLIGEAIPLGARIVAVLDAFDTMTTQRPNTPACSATAALERLRAGAGSQWDPRIVDALVECLTCEPRMGERERVMGA